ncbi:MAG: cache domain-containing protein [Coprobacillus cateniformis]|nr:cache domain-containing protein [Coprobacillus cateniformis]
MKKKVSHHQLKYFFIGSSFIIFLVIFIITNVFSRQITEMIENSEYNQLADTTDMIRRQIDNKIIEDLSFMESFSQKVIQKKHDAQSLDIFNTMRQFHATYYVDKSGQGIDNKNQNFDISELHIEEFALSKQKSGVSDCFRQEDGNMYVVYQMPLIQDKKLVGAIYCECNIQKFYKETLFAFHDGDGRAYVVDNRDGSWILKGPASPLINLSESSIYQTLLNADNSQTVVKDLANDFKAGQKAIYSVNGNQQSLYLGTTKSLNHPHWQFVTIISSHSLEVLSLQISHFLWGIRIASMLGIIILILIIYRYAQKREKQRIMEVKDQLKELIGNQDHQLQMIFTHEYDFVMKVDLNTMTLTYHVYTPTVQLWQSFLSPKYEETYQNFRARIFLDDLKAFDEICEPYHLKKLASLKEDAYVVSFRINENGEKLFFECYVMFNLFGEEKIAYFLNKLK